MKLPYLVFFLVSTTMNAQGIDNKSKSDLLSLYKEELKYQLYLDLFPFESVSFEQTFGYFERDSKTYYGPLYDNSFEHISFLFKSLRSTQLNQKEYIEKLVQLSIELKRWKPDAVSDFNRKVQPYFLEHFEEVCRLLVIKEDKDQYDFWHFWFDSPHPIEKIPNDLYNKVLLCDKNLCYLMENVHLSINKH